MRAAAGEEGWAGVGAGRRGRRLGGSWGRPPGRRRAGVGSGRRSSLSIRNKLEEVHVHVGRFSQAERELSVVRLGHEPGVRE
jgi:hypothetical protein